ncbi:hypothetical protein [Bradyrhizobium sp. SRL28]|uniref:hypothetical protein n=1 Tax=Bradyrhizobium sp. SRL28 TaxID=2836178 RepID=UPI00201CAABB|nr:hypothetical protein [Bradyrhizobium sp. SRL28]
MRRMDGPKTSSGFCAARMSKMIYLDVVYNHFGPQLNYLHSYAEPFFTDRHSTGWGPAVNLEGNHGGFVRQFLLDNALTWIRDYGFDGLRFDAVHALKDDSEKHFLLELADTIRTRLVGRHVHLMLENEANQSHLLERKTGRACLYNAQWGDDFHNALHVLLTGEKEGYYRAFADKPLDHLARSLTESFAYQDEVFPLHNKPRGAKSAHLPPDAAIFFAQNHDQVGNRAHGERLSTLVSTEKLRQAMALVLLNPHIPMLFMGEEAAAETPFLFFCDWQGEAAQLTRDGRRKEFAEFKAFSTPEMRDEIPDPKTRGHFSPRNSIGIESSMRRAAANSARSRMSCSQYGISKWCHLSRRGLLVPTPKRSDARARPWKVSTSSGIRKKRTAFRSSAALPIILYPCLKSRATSSGIRSAFR